MGKSGIFNIVGDDRVSKYEFAMLLCDKFGLDKTLIYSVCLADSKAASVEKSPRPLDMSLSNKKLISSVGSEGYSLDEMLGTMLEESVETWGPQAIKPVNGYVIMREAIVICWSIQWDKSVRD